jgi:hypothetical protein
MSAAVCPHWVAKCQSGSRRERVQSAARTSHSSVGICALQDVSRCYFWTIAVPTLICRFRHQKLNLPRPYMSHTPTQKPSRMDAVRAHLAAEERSARAMDDWATKPMISRFGTVTVSTQGVRVHDFSTKNTPNENDVPRLIIDWAIDKLLASRELFGPKPTGIDKYVDAIRHSLRSRNWFGALFLALAMPDICGALESPNDAVGVRYRRWFERYLASEYVPELFSGDDCYFLRCAALHQGLSEHPKSQNKQVVFITPPPGGHVFHSNFIESPDETFVLQLQIDVFCEQVAAGVERWKQDVADEMDIQARIGELLEFQDPTQSFKSKA